MNLQGQASLEYLLLIGGVLIVSAVVLFLVSSTFFSGQKTAESRGYVGLCSGLPREFCGVLDPDGDGILIASDCSFDEQIQQCKSGV